MDFDDHDDGDEEMPPMPVSSSYETPPQHGLAGGGMAPKPPGDIGSRVKGPSCGGGRYRECLKNHAVGIGGHAVDGCGEFMAAGEEGTIDALRCAACNCHRNFHRKESESLAGEGSPFSPAAVVPYGATPHHQFSPYYRTPAGYLHHHQHHMAAAAAAAAAAAGGHPQRPLALPSTSHSGRDDGDDLSGMVGPMSAVGPLSGMSLGAGPSGSGSGKKRFRTKFTQEQKDKMLAFAERVGWRIQKHDEAAVQQFCDEVGVKRHVLKVWMHNNKHTLGKKLP
uniref:ZF-HD dimerization-type domain-containing protein n=1 Tax=Oryza meridionalis TaxID=40149 RepID=A0A0E0ET21_9ORYZ